MTSKVLTEYSSKIIQRFRISHLLTIFIILLGLIIAWPDWRKNYLTIPLLLILIGIIKDSWVIFRYKIKFDFDKNMLSFNRSFGKTEIRSSEIKEWFLVSRRWDKNRNYLAGTDTSSLWFECKLRNRQVFRYKLNNAAGSNLITLLKRVLRTNPRYVNQKNILENIWTRFVWELTF